MPFTSPRSYPYPFSGPVPSLPAHQMPPNQVRCAIGDHLVEYHQFHQICRQPVTNGPVIIVYEGCGECLEKQLASAAPGDLSLATRALLKRALVAITQPVDEREIDAVAQAVQDALKG